MQKNFYRELNQLQQKYRESKDVDIHHKLSAYAVFDKNTDKYHVKIIDEMVSRNYILKSQRNSDSRVVSLASASNIIRKIGFMSFTVLLEGDV